MKAGAYHCIVVFALALLTAQSLHGQFVLLSESASQNVSGWAQVPGLPQVSYPPGGSVFVQNSDGVTALANSSVNANFDFSTTEIDFNSYALVDTGGGYTGSGTCYAESDFTCSLSFSVLEPVICNYTAGDLQGSGDQAVLSDQFAIESANNGVLLSQPVAFNDMLLLTPGDVYTINVSEQLTADTPDPLGNEYQKYLDFTLTSVTVVPEPSVPLQLGAGFTLIGLMTIWRRRRVRVEARRG